MGLEQHVASSRRHVEADRHAVAVVAGVASGLLAFGLVVWLLPWPACALTALGLAGWWCWRLEQAKGAFDGLERPPRPRGPA